MWKGEKKDYMTEINMKMRKIQTFYSETTLKWTKLEELQNIILTIQLQQTRESEICADKQVNETEQSP